MTNNKVNFQRGQAMMVATVLFLAISLTIIFGLVGPTVKQQKLTTQMFLSRQSYFLAEAGVEDVVYRLNTGLAVDATEVLNLNGSSATTVTTDTAEGREVNATGDVNDLVRKIRTELIMGEGVAFFYGIHIGAGGFSLSNNAGVNGNIYSNSTVSGVNGSFVTGGVSAVTSISGVTIGTGATGDANAPTVTNSTVRGTLYCKSGSGNNKACNTYGTNPVALPLPITDEQITEWKNEAALGGTIGSQTLSGTTNTLGPVKINGNLTLSNNAKLTLTGSVWVTGSVVLSNGAEVVLHSSYGELDGMMIVDGTSTLSNSSTFSGSGNSESYIMLLSTNTTESAIVLSNNAGAVILYAPYGTVQVSNNAGLNQVTAKTVSLQNNAVIDYEQGMVDASFVSGPSGGYEILDWEEVE
jgi:hypothetical protein